MTPAQAGDEQGNARYDKNFIHGWNPRALFFPALILYILRNVLGQVVIE